MRSMACSKTEREKSRLGCLVSYKGLLALGTLQVTPGPILPFSTKHAGRGRHGICHPRAVQSTQQQLRQMLTEVQSALRYHVCRRRKGYPC